MSVGKGPTGVNTYSGGGIAFVSGTESATDITVGDRQSIHDDIRYNRDTRRLCHGPEDIELFRRYVKGDHDVTVTEKQKKILENVLGHLYCDNMCEVVISETCGRLSMLGWRCDDEAVKKWMDSFYVEGNMRYISNQNQYNFSRDGNSCISLNVTNKKVRPAREVWWDGVSGIFICYSLEDMQTIRYAVKEWPVYSGGKISYYRRVVWIKGEIQRWKSEDRSKWEPFKLPEDGDRWPLPWAKKGNSGAPMEPPVVHFANTKALNLFYGLSELSGGFIASQDQINDLQMVISAASRLTGYQMYTIAGVKESKTREDGTKEEIQIGPGAVLTSTSPETRFGTLQAGSITELIEAYEHKVKTMARVARIPLHRLGQGNPPSGEALLRAEGPAISKAERQVEMCGVGYSTLGHRAVEIANAYCGEHLDEDKFVMAVMEEPDRRDRLTKSVIVNNLQGMISQREALRIMEYSEEDAQRIYDEAKEEAKDLTSIKVAGMVQGGQGGQGGPNGSGGGGSNNAEKPKSGNQPPSGTKPNQGKGK